MKNGKKLARVKISYRPVGLDCDLLGAACRIVNRNRRCFELEFAGVRVWFTRKEIEII